MRPSVLLSSKADCVVHGMGEAPILEIARRLDDGESLEDLRSMQSTAWLYGKSQAVPEGAHTITLPSFEQVRTAERTLPGPRSSSMKR